MKRGLLLGAALAWQLSAHAADTIPAHLAGVWSTAESLYAGTTEQSELYLLADGTGVIAFSSKPATHTAGPDKGKPAPNMRIIMGSLLHAVADGDELVLKPFGAPRDRIPRSDRVPISCHLEASGPSLVCSRPGEPGMVMKRRSETVPQEMARMIAGGFAEAAAHDSKASALPPAPSTPP